jgi:hypothetical protein
VANAGENATATTFTEFVRTLRMYGEINSCLLLVLARTPQAMASDAFVRVLTQLA